MVPLDGQLSPVFLTQTLLPLSSHRLRTKPVANCVVDAVHNVSNGLTTPIGPLLSTCV